MSDEYYVGVSGAEVTETFEQMMDRSLHGTEEPEYTTSDAAEVLEQELIAAMSAPEPDHYPTPDLIRAVKSEQSGDLYVPADGGDGESLYRPVPRKANDHRWVPVTDAETVGRMFLRKADFDFSSELWESKRQGSPHYGSLTHNVGGTRNYTSVPVSEIPADVVPEEANVFRDGPPLKVRVEDGEFDSPLRDVSVEVNEEDVTGTHYWLLPVELYSADIAASPYRTSVHETM